MLTCKTLFKLLLIFVLMIGQAYAATKVMYRYKNKEGITVMDNKIPAEYASQGYEILTTSGKVIKTVPRSLTPEEAEKLKAEKIAREERVKADLELKRSYSGVKDIDAAKERNLESLKANIAILKSSLEANKQELAKETARAASLERSGRKLTEQMLAKIDGLQKKEIDLKEQILQREQEVKIISKKFDQDKKRFIEITSSD